MSVQNCTVKHVICFSLSVNFFESLVELAESLRNYLEATIWVFLRVIFSLFIRVCYFSRIDSETWDIRRHHSWARRVWLPTVDVSRIPSRHQALVMLLDKHTKGDNSYLQKTHFLMTQKQLMRPEAWIWETLLKAFLSHHFPSNVFKLCISPSFPL